MGIVASLDVKPAVVFGSCLYTREVSYESDRIGISQDFRKVLNLVDIDFRYSAGN